MKNKIFNLIIAIRVFFIKLYTKRLPRETLAQYAHRILNIVPEDRWTTRDYVNHKNPKRPVCCALGHFTRLTTGNPLNYNRSLGDRGIGYELRRLTAAYIETTHDDCSDIATVNNNASVNGYKQKSPKKRTLALLNDMIEAGL